MFVHNTFTAAQVIQELQRPTLVIAHNKHLPRSYAPRFREFFPHNAVEYFVSYYDYYQPEAYIPQTDTFIEKDSSINEEIDRLRHSATQAILERRDVIIVASVSCIYGLGSPTSYRNMLVWFHTGQDYDRDDIIRRLINIQFQRNDMVLSRGTFRVKGDVLEICPKDEEIVYRVDFDWDKVRRISVVDSLTGEILEERDELTIFPRVALRVRPGQDRADFARHRRRNARSGTGVRGARQTDRSAAYRAAHEVDLEMIREVGYCSG